MCVIIARQPKVEIPFEKFKSACHVNSDGYGVSIIDRGKITTIKEYDPKGNDPEKIYKILEDAKEQQVFVHLRFLTAGVKNNDNCHPFQSTLAKEGPGARDICFMHNGTLSSFTGDKQYSDSFIFNQRVVRPLMLRTSAFLQASKTIIDKNPLHDPFVKEILSGYAGHSIFTLYDQSGEMLIINKDKGKQFEGWWASNEYSFNRYHREPYSGGRTQGQGYYGSGSRIWDDKSDWDGMPDDSRDYDRWWKNRGTNGASSSVQKAKEDGKTQGTPAGASPVTPGSGISAVKDKEERKFVTSSDGVTCEVISSGKQSKPSSVEVAASEPPARRTFSDFSGIRLEKMVQMEQADLEILVEQYPDAAVLLIQDLLAELYLKGAK